MTAVRTSYGKCKCGSVFTADSLMLSIRYRDQSSPLIVKRERVCFGCYEAHYRRGE